MNKFIFLLFIVPTALFARPWTHIELGAGNYGEDGHTKKSQRMTVARKIEIGSSSYIDELADENQFCCVPHVQYRLLFETLDSLVARYGTDEGVFHVNDLYASYAEYGAEMLRRYARDRGYARLVVDAISGDYSLIDSLETLKAYGLSKYDSAHLKNPEVSFYTVALDGLSTEKSRCAGRSLLQQLANLSSDGLYFFPVYHRYFVPLEEMALIEKGIFYQNASNFEPVPYYFPEGNEVFPASYGRVFFIPAKNPDSMASALACHF